MGHPLDIDNDASGFHVPGASTPYLDELRRRGDHLASFMGEAILAYPGMSEADIINNGLAPGRREAMAADQEWLYLPQRLEAAARRAVQALAGGPILKQIVRQEDIDNLTPDNVDATFAKYTTGMAIDPVGAVEIAERLGVQRATVDQWRQRSTNRDTPLTPADLPLFPAARWRVGGRPAWDWDLDIVPWARATGRLA